MQSWNLQQIQDKVRLLTGRRTEANLSTADLNRYVNEYYQNTLVVELPFIKEKEGWAYIATEIGQDTYDVDPEYLFLATPATINGTEVTLHFDPANFYRLWPDNDTDRPELSLNSGLTSDADWVDSNSDGVADYWELNNYGGSANVSIVTGNGFYGNAQRVDTPTVVGGDTVFLSPAYLPLTFGRRYTVTFKYRSDHPVYVSELYGQVHSFPANSGSAVQASCEFLSNGRGGLYIQGWQIGGYLEFDEVSIRQSSPLTMGFPTDALVMGSRLVLRPSPDAVYTLRCRTLSFPHALTDPTDMPMWRLVGRLVAYGTALDILLEVGQTEDAQRVNTVYDYLLNLARRPKILQLITQTPVATW